MRPKDDTFTKQLLFIKLFKILIQMHSRCLQETSAMQERQEKGKQHATKLA